MTVEFHKDHLDNEDMDVILNAMPLYGIERMAGVDDELPMRGSWRGATRFKVYDDDGNLCGSGLLDDDDECENQTAALRWAEGNWGATTIKVLRNGKWTQDIG